MNNPAATIRLPQTGHTIQIGDCKTTFLVNSNDTHGVYAVFEHDLPAGFPGPPAHAHRVTTHTFYVLEGSVTIRVGGQTVEAQAGTSVYIPAGVVHQFYNQSPASARLMEIDTPGSFQAYFEELGQAFPLGSSVDQHRMAQLQQQYDFISTSELP